MWLSIAHHAKESAWLGCLLIITALHLHVILIIMVCSEKTAKIEIKCIGSKVTRVWNELIRYTRQARPAK